MQCQAGAMTIEHVLVADDRKEASTVSMNMTDGTAGGWCARGRFPVWSDGRARGPVWGRREPRVGTRWTAV